MFVFLSLLLHRASSKLPFCASYIRLPFGVTKSPHASRMLFCAVTRACLHWSEQEYPLTKASIRQPRMGVL